MLIVVPHAQDPANYEQANALQHISRAKSDIASRWDKQLDLSIPDLLAPKEQRAPTQQLTEQQETHTVIQPLAINLTKAGVNLPAGAPVAGVEPHLTISPLAVNPDGKTLLSYVKAWLQT